MENFEDNIEKEYHERFHDFEEMPDDILWTKIEDRIKPERNRRPVFFWWQSFRMGIAASLFIGLLLGGYYYSFITTKNEVQTDNILWNKSSVGTKIAIKSTPKNQKTDENIPTLGQNFSNQAKKNNVKFEEEKQEILKKTQQNEDFGETKIEDVLSENIINEKQKSENERLLKQTNLLTENKKLTLRDEQNISSISTEKVEINDEKSLLNGDVELQKKVKNAFEEEQLTFNNKSSQDIAFFASKKVNIQLREKLVSLPTLNLLEPENDFEELPSRKLVFIPPSEVFINITPTLSYYVFSPNKGDDFLVNNINTSSERLSFSAQLGFVYPIAKKLDLRSGISFMTGRSKISYGLTNNNQKVIKVIDELNIEVQPTKSLITENRNWQYIELQSDLLYEIKKFHSLSVGMRAGVQTSMLNKPVFNGRIGYRLSKPINNRVALWFEPSISFSLSSQTSIENHFLYRTTGLGLNVGVSLLRGY